MNKIKNRIILWAGRNNVLARYVPSDVYWKAFWATFKDENPDVTLSKDVRDYFEYRT